jgi:hypothetical protein
MALSFFIASSAKAAIDEAAKQTVSRVWASIFMVLSLVEVGGVAADGPSPRSSRQAFRSADRMSLAQGAGSLGGSAHSV